MSLKAKFVICGVVICCLAGYLVVIWNVKPNQSQYQTQVQTPEQNQGPQIIKKDDQAGLDIVSGGATIEERLSLKQKAYEAMVSLANKTQDAEAAKVAEFFKIHAKTAEPVNLPEKVGYKVIEKITNTQDFFFVPLSEKDKNLKGFELLFQDDPKKDGIAGSYEPEMNVMFFPFMANESANWQTIYLFHETFHAMKFQSENYNWKDTKTFCFKELETYKFQLRLTEKVFGKDYIAFVNNKADELYAKIAKDGTLGKSWPGVKSVLPLPTYLSSKSPKEEGVIITSVWLHTMFNLVDRHFQDKPELLEDQKARILYGLYLQSGILKSTE